MEPKQIRSSVIARSLCFNGLFQPSQPYHRQQSFMSKNDQSTIPMFGDWVNNNSSKLGQERFREKQNQPKGFSQNWNTKSSYDFTVIPTKELCRVYLKKPDLLASKRIIEAQAIPPHCRKKVVKTGGMQIYGEKAKYRKFGRRYDQQNLKSKMKHDTNVDHLKPKIGLKENSLRFFSPIGASSDSHLGDLCKGKYIFHEKNSKEMKKCDNTAFHKKDKDLRVVGSKLMVSTSRDSVLSLQRNRGDRMAAYMKFKHISSVAFISKDENDESLDCSNASPGCQSNSEEAHQPSPVSVLEPIFDEDSLDDSEELAHLDFQGLEKELETLKSESESYSDGHGMEVSSDEESVLDSETEHNEQIGFFGTQESRNSSYIDNILDELVLGNTNWVLDKKHSLDLVISPKIFEKLEKKYSTQTSWKRSERKLLFDRVNSGLVEIVESFTAAPTWKKRVSRRLGTMLSTRGLKQELLKLLARQEELAKKGSLAKVPAINIGDWQKLDFDNESMIQELESMLVDELLDEFVSIM